MHPLNARARQGPSHSGLNIAVLSGGNGANPLRVPIIDSPLDLECAQGRKNHDYTFG